ncbi:MAG: lipid II flippase MurJ [Armatimonadota bacterium]|nr:lipid II flippase MurJ [Armatimonadota bacterium]
MKVTTEPAEASVGKRVAKATGAIVFFHAGMKVLGAIEKPLMAARFATGGDADAFAAASRFVLSIFLFMEQLLTHCFMAPFIQTRAAEGEKKAWLLGSTVLNLVLIGFALIGVLVFLFARPLVGVMTRFEDAATTSATAHLLRIMVPAAIVLPVTSLTYVILNAYKIFALPAAADTAFKSGTVLALLFLTFVSARMGISLLAVGIVLGAVLKLLLHLVGLGRRLRYYRPVIDLRYPPVRTVGLLAVPLMLGNVLSFIRPLVDNWLASGLTAGSVAALLYARGLVDTPSQVFPYALRIALFPFMSEMVARGERERLTEITVRSLRVVAVVFIPMTVGMLLLRYPIVQTVYEWGKFSKSSTDLVMPAFTYLTLGLMAFGAEMILLEPYFAMANTLTPTLIGVATFFLHVGFAFASVHVFGMGIGGIALAYTVARTAKVVVLALGLRGRLTAVDPRPLVSFGARLAVASALMGGVVWLALAHPVVPARFLVLKPSHLKHDARLVSVLCAAADPVSQHLVEQLSPATRQMLAAYSGSGEPDKRLKQAVVDDLNRVLAGDVLYDPQRFSHVALTGETQKLLAAQRTGSARMRLNRRLLEEAYPGEIAPPSKWGDLIRLMVPSVVGMGVFALLCLAFRIPEATYLMQAVWRRVAVRKGK